MSVNHSVVTWYSPLDWTWALALTVLLWPLVCGGLWVRGPWPVARTRLRFLTVNAVYCFTSSFQIIFQLFLFFGSLLVAIYHTILYLCLPTEPTTSYKFPALSSKLLCVPQNFFAKRLEGVQPNQANKREAH